MSLPRFEFDEIDEYAARDTIRFRRIRRSANEALRIGREFDVREYEEKLPYD